MTESVDQLPPPGFSLDATGARVWDDYDWQIPVIVKTGRPPCPNGTVQGSAEFHAQMLSPKNAKLANLWYEWYCNPNNWDELLRDCVFISDKKGQPCRLDIDNPMYRKVQRYYFHAVADSFIRIGSFWGVVLKARQLGMSLVTVGLLLCMMLTREGFQSISACDDDDKSRYMLERLRYMLSDMPAWIRPRTEFDNKKQVSLDGWPEDSPLGHRRNRSWIRVFTARAKSFGRSFTVQGFHGSEVAFWDEESGKRAYTGVTNSIPETTTGVFVVWESTANGYGSIHADLWHRAQEGSNFYTPIFIPWFWVGEYRLTADQVEQWFPGFDFAQFKAYLENGQYRKAGLDEDELRLVTMRKVDAAQLMWRRMKIAKANGDVQMFMQENPASPSEAFLVEGATVFDPKSIHEYTLRCKPPETCYQLLNEDNKNEDPDKMVLLERPDGNILTWAEPKEKHEYLVVVDPSEGADHYSERTKEGDDTAIGVWDRTKRECVCTCTGRITPYDAADIAYKLAYKYNRAMFVVENNAGYGLPIITRGKELGYEGMYMSAVYDDVNKTTLNCFGWTTTGKTRPLMFSTARGDIKKQRWKIYDREMIRQLGGMIYKKTPSGKKKEMPASGHDDRCLMAVIAMQVCKELGISVDPALDHPEHVEYELSKNLTRAEREYWQREMERDNDELRSAFSAL